MTVFCCCTAPRSSKTRSSAPKHHPALPTPPPPVRLPGPLTLNPVVPVSGGTSPRSISSLLTSVHTALGQVEPVELGELVVEDSDSEEELEPGAQNKSNSTLQLVKTRIRRHLSQDSLPRRKARSAVGSTQEEIDRRAELKRLMHKRIQEELRSEEARAATLTPSDVSSRQQPLGSSPETLPGGGPRDNLEFSVVEDTNLDMPSIGNMELDASDSHPRNLSSDQGGRGRLDGRPASCPDCDSPTKGQDRLRGRKSLPQMPPSPNLLPRRVPSTNETSSLGSWRLSYSAGQLDEFLGHIDRECMSRPGSVRKSSTSPVPRTSFSRSRLPFSGHSHSLSRSHSSPARQGTPGNDRSPTSDQSPLGTWLRSQGLRSRSPSLSRIRSYDQNGDQDASVQQAEIVYLKRWSSVQNCAVPEVDIPRPEVVHLYDMDIHRQLVTRALNTPEDSPTHSESGRKKARGGSKYQTGSDQTGTRPFEDTKGGVEGHCENMDTKKEIMASRIAKSSSIYPSTSNSVDPSSGTSSSYLLDSAANRKTVLIMSMPGFKWLDSSDNPHLVNASEKSSHQTTGKRSSDNLTSLDTWARTMVSSPAPVSESSSRPKKETREASPSITIEKSISHFHLGHGAPPMVVKRIQQKVDRPPGPLESSPKPSLLARLHLTFPRRAKLAPTSFDGSGSEEQPRLQPFSRGALVAHTPSRSQSRASERAHWSPYSPSAPGISDNDDSTAELWQRAIREEARTRTPAGRRSANHHRGSSLPDDNTEKRRTKSDTSSLRDHRSSPTGCKGGHITEDTDERLVLTPRLSPSHVGNNVAMALSQSARPDNSSSVAHSPIHDKGASSRAPVHDKVDARKFARFPDSWAKFPSHNRAERNGPAGLADQVTTRDFAVSVAPEQEVTDYFTEGDSDIATPKQSAKRSPHSIPGRLGRAVKSGFSRLIPSRTSPGGTSPMAPRSRRQSSDHSRGSRGNLEYPELELLPMESGYQELRALEQEIQHMKGTPQLQYPVPLRNMEGDGGKVPLSVKMATVLHTDGTSEHEPLHVPRIALVRRLLTTPANTASHGKESTTASDQFVTPMNSTPSSNATSSFHSYPHSRPQSLALPVSVGVRTEVSTDVDSEKSDVSFVKRLRLMAVSSVASSGAVVAAKLGTWDGRSRTVPSLWAGSSEQVDGDTSGHSQTAFLKASSLREMESSFFVGSDQTVINDSVVSV
ncbi:hypothetical protein B0T22DRAFT_267493 [Podospora appendiculata]|uniref:Uncharacterized protein n=1 Tax=Podospora appendiculata TaxID=314037 RepID=A0AAE0X3U5_9PEZI|nr:hypothetical protein B0T22DRAFT_267493 [Podospora appendiculata]